MHSIIYGYFEIAAKEGDMTGLKGTSKITGLPFGALLTTTCRYGHGLRWSAGSSIVVAL